MDDPDSLIGSLRLLLILLLVLLNGFFVMSEFALVTVRRSWVETLARRGNQRAAVLQRVISNIDDYIAATQLGITMASLALGWIGEPALARLLEPVVAPLTSPVLVSFARHTVAVVLAFTIITFLHVVVGELAPKTLALERTQSIALWVARPMEIFYRAFKPFIIVLNRSGIFVLRLLGIPPTHGHGGMYAEEIQHLINVSHEQGLLEPVEHQLISNVFSFSGATVREAMRPRAEVTAIEAATPFEEIIRTFETSGYSRIPVYREQWDNIVGVLHSKDLMRYLRQPDRFRIEQVVHSPFFVPDSAALDDVLRQMRQRKNHFALVVDEYGAIEGIITLEDILEELVGEIHDEHDLEEERILRRPDGTIVLAGSVTVREVNRALGLNLPESDDYNTVAGLLMTRTGRLPLLGDRISYNGVTFTVEKMEGRRVTRLRLEFDEPAVVTPPSTAAVKNETDACRPVSSSGAGQAHHPADQ